MQPSLSKQFLTNVSATYVNTFVSVVVALFFTPYFIGELGKEEYGLWNLTLSMVAYLRLVDSGMSQSLVRYVSKYLVREDWTSLNTLLSTSARLYSIAAGVAVIAAVLIAFVALPYTQVPLQLQSIARIVVILLGIRQAVSFLFMPIASMGPFNRFDVTAYAELIISLAQVGGIIAILELDGGLVEIAGLVLTLGLTSSLVMSRVRHRFFPAVKVSFRKFDKQMAGQIYDYGKYSFLAILASMVVYQTDNIVIGALISIEAVAVYAIASMFLVRLRMGVNTIAVNLVPGISQLEAVGRWETIEELLSKSIRYLFFLSGFVVAFSVTLAEDFILLWVGEGFTESVDPLIVLALGAALAYPLSGANSVLRGISRHRIVFYIIAAEAAANVLLSVALAPRYGIYGVALGTALPQALIYSVVYPIVLNRVLRYPTSRFYLIAVSSLVKSLVPILGTAWLLTNLLDGGTWLHFAVSMSSIVVVAGVLFVTTTVEADDRHRVLEWIGIR